ncbi:ATP synthase F0F1 subunit gamma [Candidatus Liberibacter solanacearum]|uniref:ATP synthase gamma chain n=1 Tax=Candidatus Liberibacter solanacearum TaxID=556287 RepID=A0A094Z2X3_9HYPH|nr:F0F1 ATP synthase subunit gamma [Candidatus Liberibacter solanacearum]KGB27269.1 ATP synthase F0F1 subunit gamma [Candidatus Liberibacter solanacearum]KJZ81988.1 ATP synthase gamma chain [Candidatus Liberibacter solanacearum]KQC49578.1 ATP synthase F0F1 subunit gamma [Candidatus Liberibacter solanacearum]
MASLKELKNRIHSVKETQKITEAMQLVSVTKLRRAKEAIQNASLYQSHIRDFFIKCAVDEFSLEDISPLIRGRGRSEVYLFIVCTAEKGLCGGFNSQIIRFARERIRRVIADNKQVKILTIGRKGHEGLYKEFSSMIIDSVELPSKKEIDFAQAHNIAQKVISLFTSNVFDVCFCIHSEFKSIIQQIPIISKIIPVDFVRNYKDRKEENLSIYHYESTVYSVLEKILFQSISAQIFWALLENKASEIGARITAMDNATRNAGRMVEHLILSYNRQRQMRITTDLIEIIAGAEAV